MSKDIITQILNGVSLGIELDIHPTNKLTGSERLIISGWQAYWSMPRGSGIGLCRLLLRVRDGKLEVSEMTKAEYQGRASATIALREVFKFELADPDLFDHIRNVLATRFLYFGKEELVFSSSSSSPLHASHPMQ